jgi:hypothetical protein
VRVNYRKPQGAFCKMARALRVADLVATWRAAVGGSTAGLWTRGRGGWLTGPRWTGPSGRGRGGRPRRRHGCGFEVRRGGELWHSGARQGHGHVARGAAEPVRALAARMEGRGAWSTAAGGRRRPQSSGERWRLKEREGGRKKGTGVVVTLLRTPRAGRRRRRWGRGGDHRRQAPPRGGGGDRGSRLGLR